MSSGDSETKEKILAAARALIAECEGRYVSLAEIGRRAGVSRQAIYLHFASRFDLLRQLADYVDEVEGLPELQEWVLAADFPAEMLDRIAALHATHRPKVAHVATALDRAILEEPELEEIWQDRIAGRRELARHAARLMQDHNALLPHWDEETAVDFIAAVDSFQTWRELVMGRTWSAEQYHRMVSRILRETLLKPEARELPGACSP